MLHRLQILQRFQAASNIFAMVRQPFITKTTGKTPLFRFSGCLNPKRQPEKTKPFGILPNGFLLNRLSFRLPNASQMFNAAATPLRPAERSILFSEKSVRLSDDARSAASSHAPKKGCGVREVRVANLHVGVAFLLLTFLWRSKEK